MSARWHISTLEHLKPPENRKMRTGTAISLTTAPQVPYRQQKGRQREPMGGFLRAVCLASGGSRLRLIRFRTKRTDLHTDRIILNR